jgi:hypothetical protein
MEGRREKRQIKLSGELGELGVTPAKSLRESVLEYPQHSALVVGKLGELGVS